MKALISFAATLGWAAFASLSVTPAYAWTDSNPAVASQCVNADINDAGTVITDCKVSNASVAYVTVSGAQTQLAALLSTPGNVPCIASAVNNAAAGKETIIGSCVDGNNVAQAVAWNSGAPGTPTQLAPFAGLLGLIGAGVKTRATDVNIQGISIGVSIDANESALPVFWSSNGTATPLNVALLSGLPQINCFPISINDAATPAIVGNCPGSSGKNNAVLWTSPSAPGYVVLPVPSGASYCSAGKVNLGGQILGQCIYGTDTRRAVQWGPGGTGPTVLLTVNGGTALRTLGIDMNDSGVVAITYLAGGAQAGFAESATWNPFSGNTNATSITLPSGAIHGTQVLIGNNGKMAGNFETSGGDTHPMHVEPGSFTAVDDGSPEGGPNAAVTALSKSGTYEAGGGENSNEDAQGISQPTP